MANKKNLVWLDDKKVQVAFLGARSMTEVIQNLGQPLGSASFLNVKRAAERLGLVVPFGERFQDTTNARFINTIPLEEILVERSIYSNRQSLKKRLIQAGLKENKCEVCGCLPIWNGKPLVLQVDHINGVGDDNRIENLRVICPNCHTQTETFGYRKYKPKEVRLDGRKNPRPYMEKVVWPSQEDLILEVQQTSKSAVAKRLGVSETAVRKRIKTH